MHQHRYHKLKCADRIIHQNFWLHQFTLSKSSENISKHRVANQQANHPKFSKSAGHLELIESMVTSILEASARAHYTMEVSRKI
jgi:hypothetical protein